MRWTISLLSVLGSIASAATTSWTFSDASLTIQAKGAGIGSGVTESLSPNTILKTKSLSLSPTDTLKVSISAKEGSGAGKPHQAYLQLRDAQSGLEDSFPFVLKANGKGKVEITQKDIPEQLLFATQPVQASIILASFGTSAGYSQHAFDVSLVKDETAPVPTPEAPERYGKKPEIFHVFKDDPKSAPRIVSLVFTLAVLAAFPVLLGSWALLGGNLSHAGQAMQAQPIAHALFFGSILAMEGVFGMYYLSWNLFQTLPVAGVVAVVAYISGSRALTEVQERRLAGHR